VLVTGSNRGAAREDKEPHHAGWYAEASIWWAWTATNSGLTTISCTLSNSHYPRLGVYTGNTLSNLVAVAGAAGADGLAVVEFIATSGQNYKIAVDSGTWEAGDVLLDIRPSSSQLALGVAKSNLSGTLDSQTPYLVSIPSGLASLQVSISGGTGDCDLYVSYGLWPTLDDYGYAPYLDGNNETVSITNPAAGDWYIMLHGFDSYSGVTLLALASGGGTNPPTSSTNGMVLIPAGSFTMGDTLDGDSDAIPTSVYVSAI
jgi:serine protease